jgi:asparagine synthase (glutamine-hydrolysing)
MVAMLQRRGPDGSNVWCEGPVGLAQTMLVTSPEAGHERLPHVSKEGDLVIVADARIDNREELIAVLGLQDRERDKHGDSELILEAYRKWGEACPVKLLGDFAFAVWDMRQQKLFCARDHFGVRPFYYYHDPGRIFVFGSEPRASLVLKQVPYKINEARIADFLITQLEGIDKTSSFFEDVYRLPPAHTFILTQDNARQQQYWALEPGPELKLGSNEEYSEAFLDVFTKAVQCRLRGNGLVGAMLSGGMDSGSIVAVARELLAEKGMGPLPTFSAVGPDPETCVETRTINEALAMDGLDPHLVHLEKLEELLPDLEGLTWSLDEPFDNHMTLIRAIYLAARRNNLKAVLDGGDGDLILSEGSHIVRLIQRGHWLAAYREAKGQESFWSNAYPARRELFRSACRAFVPQPVWHLRHAVRSRISQKSAEKNIQKSIICPLFAQSVTLSKRLNTLASHGSQGVLIEYQQERIQAIDHPYLTVGIERYNRVASALAIEPRHPFLDRRVVEFCITLPSGQKMNQGWPKAIMRRSMADRLPDSVRWRIGKQNLGWAFTKELMNNMQERLKIAITENIDILLKFVDGDSVHNACRSYFDGKDPSQAEKIYETAHLAVWVRHHKERPQLKSKIPDTSFTFEHPKGE